ncbi:MULTISPECIES: hypothetical protein [unclassified Bradyrhizobium]|uniref:hypothetical protein n=1 Tax=unclassified Bradyrhizobium TaxID=2631580 RepID=UPI002FF07C8A
MWQQWKLKFWNWVRNSGTIAWARLQILVGCIWVALQATDLSPLLPPKYFTAWLIISGFITEYIRRRGTEVVSTDAYVPDVGHVEVVKLVDTSAAPKG